MTIIDKLNEFLFQLRLEGGEEALAGEPNLVAVVVAVVVEALVPGRVN